MTADHKQLAQELYEALKEANRYLPVDRRFTNVNRILQKYEEAITRGTGRTTALYMKAITEALENPGKSVEFIDHYPMRHNVEQHANNIKDIIEKLGYNITVSRPINTNQVFLYDRFGQ
jgi:hypothetical protein